MELKAYARIVCRRWWLMVCLVGIVFLASLPGVLSPKPLVYQASLRFAVGVAPEPRSGDYYTYDRYYTWLASEYLLDDLAEVVKSDLFAGMVSAALADKGIRVPRGAIQGSTQAGKLHRLLTINITWAKEGELRDIANAATTVLQARSAEFLAQLGAENADARLIDPPAVYPLGLSLRERLDVPIRLFLALIAGVALIFLLDYLDDAVRDGTELEAMGLVVLGQLPPWPRKGRLLWRKRRR